MALQLELLLLELQLLVVMPQVSVHTAPVAMKLDVFFVCVFSTVEVKKQAAEGCISCDWKRQTPSSTPFSQSPLTCCCHLLVSLIILYFFPSTAKEEEKKEEKKEESEESDDDMGFGLFD